MPMKLLVVLGRPPHPEAGAADRTAVGLLLGLRANGVEVSALAARPPGWQYDSPDELGVEIVDVPAGDDWRSRLGRVRRPLGALSRTVFGERVRAAAASVDAVHLETIDTVWCADGITVPSGLHLHYLARADRRRSLADAEYVLAERLALRRYSHLIVSSQSVANAVGPGATTMRLSLDPARYHAAPLQDRVAGIIGTASWAPTARAVDQLLSDVWPRVRERVPDARLRIAGRGFAEVSSSAEFLRSLSVLLYPLERGTGAKVKTLEAIASGVPVVTTPAGADGIAESEGVIVAAPADLADAAALLLLDEGERRRRGAAARATFLSSHAPALATKPLVELYARLTNSPAHAVSSSK
jgi:glycosyltransferase involved in cell wall biosynthesis